MKKINKKYIFGKFSILDIIIILVFIVALFICYNFMGGNKNNKTSNKTITYTLKVNELEQDVIDNIKIGDYLYYVKNNNKVGKIININVEKSYLYLYNYEEKNYRKSEMKDKYDIYLDIESDVYETESSLLIGNLDIKANTNISLRSKKYSIYGNIINISR